MSGNAALAAARRRRGEEPTNNIQSNKFNKPFFSKYKLL